MTTDTKPFLSKLEAASDAADAAHEKAASDLDKVRAMINALILAEDHASDPSLPVAVRRILHAQIDWTAITALKDEAAKMAREVERLDSLRVDALNALDSADEAA